MTTVIHHKERSKIFANNEVYIGRPSKWGNQFTHLKSTTLAKYHVDTREQAIEAYRKWITDGEGKHLLQDLHELKDKVLVCWCKPKSCHGDVLIELLNRIVGDERSVATEAKSGNKKLSTKVSNQKRQI